MITSLPVQRTIPPGWEVIEGDMRIRLTHDLSLTEERMRGRGWVLLEGENLPAPKSTAPKRAPRARRSSIQPTFTGPLPAPTEGRHPTTGNAYKVWEYLHSALGALALPWNAARCGIGAVKVAKFAADQWVNDATRNIQEACTASAIPGVPAGKIAKEFVKLTKDLDHTNPHAVEAATLIYADWLQRLWSTMVQKGQWDTSRWDKT